MAASAKKNSANSGLALEELFSDGEGVSGISFAACLRAMLFSQPSSKLELARRAAADAAKNVAGSAGSLADSAQALAGSAGSILGSAAHNAADSAQSLAQTAAGSAQSLAQSAVGSAQSLAQTAGKGASTASEILSSKAGALLHRGGETVVETAKATSGAVDVASDSVEAARVKALAAQKTAEASARESEAAAREAQKRAEAEIARYEQQLAGKRAEFEAQQKSVEVRQSELNSASADSAREAEEIRLRRSAPVHIDVEEQPEGDFEYQVVKEKKSGFSIWTLLGAAVLIGAALYFLVPKGGRRSRAAIKDRLNKVKGDLVDKTTSAADAASDKVEGATETATNARETTTAPTGAVVESHTVTSDSVEGVAIEGTRAARIETAGTVAEAGDGPQHPNIFDKVAGVVGSAASATEHFAGDAKDDAVQDASGAGETQSDGAKNSKKSG